MTKPKGHYFISTYNGAKDAQEMLNTQIKVLDKVLYLKDIATVEKRYEDTSTLYSIDSKHAVDLSVKQSNVGNALELAKAITLLVEKANISHQDIEYTIHDNKSVAIKDRLNIVISNILLGIVLISLLVALLINSRMSLIITLGIPTSFVMGASYLYIAGYSINMISLIGVLIALGIIVDDAIVVSENIQQHIEDGLSPQEASVIGAKEMFKPVTIASMTTLFAFIPALMMSGTMGEVIRLIPIAVAVLVLASLVESFLFLPIHASHLLKKNQKSTSWKGVNRIYSWIIHFFIHYKKTFFLLFILLVPLAIVMGMKASKFQMFPHFDASTIKITLKAPVNSSTEETMAYLKTIETALFLAKKAFSIAHITSVAGWRKDASGNSETYPYVGQMTIELEKLKAQNILDQYITPFLSFYYDKEGRTREEKSVVIAQKLRLFLQEHEYKKRYGLSDLAIVERKVGPIKSDLKIGFVSEDNQKIMAFTDKIKTVLKNLEGVVSVSDSMNYGKEEIKLQVNAYGESLGFNEQKLGLLLSNFYLERRLGFSFDSSHLLSLKIQSLHKDSLSKFKNLQVKIDDNRFVRLQEIVHFHTIKSFEKIIKDAGEKHFYVYANVDAKKLTATETLSLLDDLLSQAKDSGIKIILKGEEEKKKELKSDMLTASAVAMLLILLSLLYLFNSFRETFMMMSVIPFAFLGVIMGHLLLGINLSMPSIIGMLGLSGVVINDGIIMILNLKKAQNMDEIFFYASKRFRPIMLTSITTLIGLGSLVFFPTGQATIFQPMAISLAFGLAWGTVLNLLYLPVLYTIINQKRLGI
ncbi:MAG: efflux RND transporter permease subunit [Sulfurovum sp.]|nr:efflux RND transporter permease subunit [Sulfurovum sp.]